MKNIIHHKTLREQIADVIRKRILMHELEPGMRITESELAKEFGVSHGPVREALRQLEQEGLVEYTRNVGCSVSDISFSSVIEALLIRGSYELTAARACKGNLSDKALARMVDVLKSMKNMDASDYTESMLCDNAFHKILITESHMPYLINAWSALDFAIFFNFYSLTGNRASVVSRQYDAHKKIYNVYASGNLDAICDTISRHYMNSINTMLKNNNMTENDFPFSFDIIKQ